MYNDGWEGDRENRQRPYGGRDDGQQYNSNIAPNIGGN